MDDLQDAVDRTRGGSIGEEQVNNLRRARAREQAAHDALHKPRSREKPRADRGSAGAHGRSGAGGSD